jgi:hypothetical protein
MCENAAILITSGPDTYRIAEVKKADPYWLAPDFIRWLTMELPGSASLSLAESLAEMQGLRLLV